MGMARIPVAELQVQSQGPGLVRANANDLSGRRGDVRDWAQRSPVSAGAMIFGGLGIAAIGALGALLTTVGFFGTVALGSMMTVGGGVAFLGVLKAKGRSEPVVPKALPPASATTVIAERGRRILSVLEQSGDLTFEHLLAQLRWTEGALLEALMAMKESGQVVEDLDLDTGQWVYRSQLTDYGGAGPMTLEDRQARHFHTEA